MPALDWKKVEDGIMVNYPEGNILVDEKDFNRAFGAIVNAPYEAAKRDFAIVSKNSSLDEQIKNANSKKEPAREGKPSASKSEMTI